MTDESLRTVPAGWIYMKGPIATAGDEPDESIRAYDDDRCQWSIEPALGRFYIDYIVREESIHAKLRRHKPRYKVVNERWVEVRQEELQPERNRLRDVWEECKRDAKNLVIACDPYSTEEIIKDGCYTIKVRGKGLVKKVLHYSLGQGTTLKMVSREMTKGQCQIGYAYLGDSKIMPIITINRKYLEDNSMQYLNYINYGCIVLVPKAWEKEAEWMIKEGDRYKIVLL
jgi:hypothetical protein